MTDTGTIILSTLEDLLPFLDEHGVLELVIRRQDKRFEAFQKLIINGDLLKSQEAELAQKVARALNERTHLGEHVLKLLTTVEASTGIAGVLGAINLCATIAGFALIHADLQTLDDNIDVKIERVGESIRQSRDISNDFRLNTALSEHMEMLDRKRRHRPFTEDEVRELVDHEYRVLRLLISTLRKGTSSDRGALIRSILSLLAMLTVSLTTFDELYYLNNREVLEDNRPWHMSHDTWMQVYDELTSQWFVEALQDFGSFETRLSTIGVDLYYTSLIDQVRDLREEVEDNQELLIALGDPGLFMRYRDLSAKDVAETIEAAYRKAGSSMDDSTVDAALRNALGLAGIATG